MNVFSLSALLTLDDSEYDKKLGDAAKKGEGFGSKLKHAMGVGVKAIGTGIAAGATAVAKLTKSATEAYADYEQLFGGVETLFGAGGMSLQEYAQSVGKSSSLVADEYGKMMTAQNEVLRNAQEAYKTAGLSTNDYLETVTSFSAALIGSLEGDTVAASKLADQAIRDMSDNANKMGTDMEAIQNAYNGFAKGNFTMLDNLKLGFGGTKEEMQRLLDTAHELTGVDYNIDSYADIVNAINAVQTEMGITGTTAKEAASTISGSVGMMKGAWQNLVAGLGDSNADMDKLLGDLVDSAETAFENILPVAEKALGGIATAIEKLAPVIAEKFPGLVEKVLPPLLSAATTLVNALVENLPTIINVIIEALPEIITSVTTALADASPQLVEAGILLTIALMNGLIQAIPVLVDKIPEIVKAVWETIKAHAPEMLQASSELINQLLIGIGKLLGKVADKGREILNKVKEGINGAISSLLSVGRNIVEGIWNGISNGLGWIKNKISGWVGNVTSFIKSLFGIHSPSTVMRDEVGKFLALGIGEGFVDEMGLVERMMQNAMPDVGSLVGPIDIKARRGSGNGEVLSLLREIRDNIGNDMYLDGGTLVGYIDKAMGRKAMQRSRGNA